jgi:glycosyltransferase involved in cell wall biosynthesis
MSQDERIPSEELPIVVFVAVPSALGGSNRALLTVLGEFTGRLTRVMAAPSGGALAGTIRERSLVEDWIPMMRVRRARRIARVLSALRLMVWVTRRRRAVLALHANATTGLYLAAPAALVSRLPLVVWVHDSVSTPWGRRLGPLLRWLLPQTRWLAVSPTAREVIVANGLSPADQVTIVPNPFDRGRVVASARHVADSGRVRIGFLGRATDAKGFDLLPEVMRLTADLPITWKLFVNRGDGTPHPSWELIDRLDGLQVETVGRLRDVREAYAQSDLVFNPSRFESYSRVIAEALMNGIPVVATDLAPIRALVDSDSGVLFDAGDPFAASDAIRKAVVDLASWRAQFPETTVEFDPSNIAEVLLEAYSAGKRSGEPRSAR